MSCWLVRMYLAKFKQSKSHTSLTTLCSRSHLSKVFRSWLNLPTGGHGHVICMYAWCSWVNERWRHRQGLWHNATFAFWIRLLTSEFWPATAMCDFWWYNNRRHLSDKRHMSDNTDFPKRPNHTSMASLIYWHRHIIARLDWPLSMVYLG